MTTILKYWNLLLDIIFDRTNPFDNPVEPQYENMNPDKFPPEPIAAGSFADDLTRKLPPQMRPDARPVNPGGNAHDRRKVRREVARECHLKNGPDECMDCPEATDCVSRPKDHTLAAMEYLKKTVK